MIYSRPLTPAPSVVPYWRPADRTRSARPPRPTAHARSRSGSHLPGLSARALHLPLRFNGFLFIYALIIHAAYLAVKCPHTKNIVCTTVGSQPVSPFSYMIKYDIANYMQCAFILAQWHNSLVVISREYPIFHGFRSRRHETPIPLPPFPAAAGNEAAGLRPASPAAGGAPRQPNACIMRPWFRVSGPAARHAPHRPSTCFMRLQFQVSGPAAGGALRRPNTCVMRLRVQVSGLTAGHVSLTPRMHYVSAGPEGPALSQDARFANSTHALFICGAKGPGLTTAAQTGEFILFSN